MLHMHELYATLKVSYILESFSSVSHQGFVFPIFKGTDAT